MLLLGALAVAACGGDDGGAESSGADAADDASAGDDDGGAESSGTDAADDASAGDDDGGAESSGDDAADDAGETDDGTGEATMSPEEVIEAYRLAYNGGDMDAVVALFSNGSAVVDHPSALYQGVGDGGNTLIGVDLIREANVVDRAGAAEAGAYEFLNVEVSGDTVTWDHTWEGVNGAEWCGEGHNAVIVDRVFVTWNYAQDTHPCSPDCTFADVFQDPLPDVCRRS